MLQSAAGSMEVTAKLLALAASVSWDGGDGVLRTLREILNQDAPFDAGEVALLRSPGFQRWSLTGDADPVAADDLLERAAVADGPIRIDDILEIRFAMLTRELMTARGLRSCLALPLSGAGGPEGAIVIAREHGWAFAGVSLKILWPVASMTGLCLARSVALTALKRDADSVRVSSRAQEEGMRKSLLTLEGDVHDMRRALEQAQQEKATALADLRDAEELFQAEAARAETLVGLLRESQAQADARTAELASAIQRVSELDRKLAERERELELVPPPPTKRRRRPRNAVLDAESPDSPPGGEPGPSSGS